jgi:hypothetical protein
MSADLRRIVTAILRHAVRENVFKQRSIMRQQAHN